jgi:hypothetical protein
MIMMMMLLSSINQTLLKDTFIAQSREFQAFLEIDRNVADIGDLYPREIKVLPYLTPSFCFFSYFCNACVTISLPDHCSR